MTQVDLYFGAKAPTCKEANWVPTAPGTTWFTLFRFYGPDKALFDRSWELTDF